VIEYRDPDGRAAIGTGACAALGARRHFAGFSARGAYALAGQ